MSQRRGEETKESRGGREGCGWDGEGGISESGEKRSLADPKMHSSHPDWEGGRDECEGGGGEEGRRGRGNEEKRGEKGKGGRGRSGSGGGRGEKRERRVREKGGSDGRCGSEVRSWGAVGGGG